MENLLGRIGGLSKLLQMGCGGEEEQKHRAELQKYAQLVYYTILSNSWLDSELEKITGTLEPLKGRNIATRVIAAGGDAALIQGFIVQVERALVDYQVLLAARIILIRY